jgi:DNA-binding NarL/FixJ family response regulator
LLWVLPSTDFAQAWRAVDPPTEKILPMTRVLVVDDHHFFRSCLVDLINASGDIAVIGECTDGSQVLATVDQLRPDVVLMDVRMPHLSGLQVAAALQVKDPQVGVVLLTSDTASSSRAAARASGVVGYLLKGSDPDLILDALRHSGRTSTTTRSLPDLHRSGTGPSS